MYVFVLLVVLTLVPILNNRMVILIVQENGGGLHENWMRNWWYMLGYNQLWSFFYDGRICLIRFWIFVTLRAVYYTLSIFFVTL